MKYGADECDTGGFNTKLPFPFLLLVTGYTIILVIDKVLFDTHAILGHDEHGDGGGESQLRKSIASVLRESQVNGGKPSSISIENALR